MGRITRILPVLGFGVLLASPAGAMNPRFLGLEDLEGAGFYSRALGVASDGSAVIGVSKSSDFPEGEAFRWTDGGGMVGLGSLPSFLRFSSASAISDDGAVVVGESTSFDGLLEAFRWESGHSVGLGFLPGFDLSKALGVSGSGEVVVGFSRLLFKEAFRWTESGGIDGLGFLPGDNNSRALGASFDGSVVVGFAGEIGQHGCEAFRWTEETGLFGLGSLVGPEGESHATAVSSDGSVVVGASENAAGGMEAFRWSAAGMVGLGGLDGADSEALAVSSDGSRIVGTSGGRAFIWDADGGMQDVQLLLVQSGLEQNLTGWTLREATGIAGGNTVVGWGTNPAGETEAWLAVVVPAEMSARPAMRWLAGEAGSDQTHSCGILANGSVACWGAGSFGQTTPPNGSFAQVVTGADHSCGRRFDDSVECWGRNDSGQAPPLRPGPYRTIAAGSNHGCGILSGSGFVDCWGSNSDGQRDLPPEQVGQIFLEVTAGSRHSCGRRSDLATVCWGANEAGQAESPGEFVQGIDAGSNFNCGLRNDGSPRCWGSNSDGQLDPPVGLALTSVSAGGAHACGITDVGTLACWGRGANGDPPGQATPPPGLFESVSAGGDHTCATQSDGVLVCFGADDDGESTVPVLPVPVLAAGADFTCAIQPDNEIECWGDPASYDPIPGGTYSDIEAGLFSACAITTGGTATCFGTDTNGNTMAPVGTFFQELAAAESVTCGRRDDGTVTCWGFDDSQTEQAPPDRFQAIAAGRIHACGVLESGALKCWGESFGAPTAGEYDQITAGYEHTCARFSNGTVTCFGSNDDGQLDAPTGTFDAIFAGAYHTCGIRGGGGLECWGRGENGQGDREATPPSGQYLSGSGGEAHSCAVATNGAIACFGSNVDGQVAGPGDGDGDGVADVIDNCPLVANGPNEANVPDVGNQSDRDGDEVGDACDLCPDVPDAQQLESDGDGFGNSCDVCPFVADPLQEVNENGEGVLCARTKVFYKGTFVAGVGGGGALPGISGPAGGSLLELRAQCGSNDISQIVLAVVFPPEITASQITVAGDSTSTGCEGPGLVGGVDYGDFCNQASSDPNIFGDTIDPSASWVIEPGAPNPGANTNENALYFKMVGLEATPGGTRVLCETGQDVLLAVIEVLGLADAALAPPFTAQGLEEIVQDLPPQTSVVGTDNEEIDSAEVLLESGPDAPSLTLEIIPALAELNTWHVLLSSNVHIQTLRYALTGFTGAGPQDLEVHNCNVDVGFPVRACAPSDGTFPNDFPFENVDVGQTFTVGPDAGLGVSPIRGDTLYVESHGNAVSAFGPTMNPSDPAAPPEDLHPTARIATVVFNPPPDPDASDLRQPYITFQGVEELFGGPVFIRTGDATPGTGGEVRVSGSFLLPEDSDGDGLVDPFDNCTWVDNFFQIDDGSVETPLNPGGILWDGIGKKCQCGDARFLDGRVVGADSGGILDIVVGKSLDPESENLASTEGDPQVNLLDWLTVELNRDGRGLVGPSCPPARPPQ